MFPVFKPFLTKIKPNYYISLGLRILASGDYFFGMESRIAQKIGSHIHNPKYNRLNGIGLIVKSRKLCLEIEGMKDSIVTFKR
jgi:hypothetical protein